MKPNQKLVDYVEQHIIPLYDNFDAAHHTDHVQTVIGESLKLAEHYIVNIDMVYAVAAFHDTGLQFGRENHHIDSGKLIRADNFLRNFFTPEELETVAQAAEDHRASSDHEPRSIYGRIVAEADRIIIPEVCLTRTVQYGLEHHPELDKEGQYARFAAHLAKKYGVGGYIRFWIPYSQNKANLEQLRTIINSPEELRSSFDRIYNACTYKL